MWPHKWAAQAFSVMVVTAIVHEWLLMHKLLWETRGPLKTAYAKSNLYYHVCGIFATEVSAMKIVLNRGTDGVAIHSFGMGGVTIV